jgi:hypothetical protein
MINILFVGADLETRGPALCLRLVRRPVPVPCLVGEPQFQAVLRTARFIFTSKNEIP